MKSKKFPVESILEEAHALINGDRRKAYGGTLESFEAPAALWSVILKTKVTAKQVALCMAAYKIAREVTGEPKRDNRVDACGYIALADQLS